MARRLLLAATAAIALAATAGMGTVTAQAAAPSAAAAPTITSQRVCSATPARGHASCLALRRTDAAAKEFGRVMAKARPGSNPLAGTTDYQKGLRPQDLQVAYGLAAASSSNGNNLTVAIVDAYDAPRAWQDVNTYRAKFGIPTLPDCSATATTTPCFKKVNQRGGTTYPAIDTGWAQEISLDVDMVSAICPKCSILLVEADSSSLANLGTAVRYAAGLKPVAISNSYGGSDLPDSSYGQPYNQPGIAVTVSSGDNGYGVEFPASSRYVTAVGGTSLTLNSTGTARASEKAWSGAGSGCSRYNVRIQPSRFYTGCSTRAVADVSAVADPATGVAVYDSIADSSGNVGWLVFGGTSVSSPIIASVYALANNVTGTANAIPYNAGSSAFNDVTSGSNGHCRAKVLCTAGASWDGPTGLGTPNGISGF